MYRFAVFAGCVLLGVGGQVAAQCSDDRVPDLDQFLLNKTVCGTGAGPSVGNRWQEWHQGGGVLTEYALGPGHAVDPTQDVGNWSATAGASSTVTYTYGASGPYVRAVYDNGGGSYSFCDGATEVATATLLNGQAPCGP